MKFILAADTSGDIPRNEMRARGIEYKPLVYTIDGVEYADEFSSDAEYKGFYDAIRAGKMPTTSQINVTEHEEFFESIVEKHGCDMLYVTLSSGLSGSCASAKQAAQTVSEKTGKRIVVVDSLGATISQRLVVDEAERLRDADASVDEAAEFLNDFVKHIHTWFMPTDLMHLKRGGRVSGPAAYIGTALKVKPILFIDKAGCLPVMKKVMGAVKGVAYMAEIFSESCAKEPHHFYIASADSELAPELLKRAQELRPDLSGKIGWIGPVIGAHTGCGAVGISFISDKERPY